MSERNVLSLFLSRRGWGFYCSTMISIYTTLELIFPKEYNIANDEYDRFIRTQSMVFGFITVLLTYCICVILLKYGTSVMRDEICCIGNSFALQILLITLKSIGDMLGSVIK